AQVFFGAIAEHGDDGRGLAAFGELFGQQGYGMHVAAGGDADEQGFFAREAADHRVGVFGFDPEVAVGEFLVVNARDDGGGHVFEAFESVEAAGGLGGEDLNAGDVALEAAAGSHEGSTGAHGGDEVSDRTRGLLNDFSAGAFEVGLPVGGVVVL